MANDLTKPADKKSESVKEPVTNDKSLQSSNAEKPKEKKLPETPKQPNSPPKTEKVDKPIKESQDNKSKPESKSISTTKEKTATNAEPKKTATPTKEENPKSTESTNTPQATKQQEPEAPPPEPTLDPRTGEKEEIVYVNLSEIRPFKDHPFQVKMDAAMMAMVESVRDKGVTQPTTVRPHKDGGYEMVSGHRRQLASELANRINMPCIVRNLTDEQAITQMVEDNTNQRESILPSERGAALKMQLDAIKRQGSRGDDNTKGQRSNAIVAERNNMTVKQVQRYIKLTGLVPDLAKMVDDKKIAFTPAVELAFISLKNQNYIAVAIEGNQSTPSLSQAKRLKELDESGKLNADMIDGILMEEKKEVDHVILSSKELAPFFGNDKSPREMKDAILKLLEDNKAKNPPELGNNKQPKAQER